MSLRLYKVSKISQVPPPLDNYTYINALSWFPNNKIVLHGQTINLYELSPYYLKDENGYLFENLWQGSKIYRHVTQQHQIISNKLIWDHPEETHVDDDGTIFPAYWSWRQKLFSNPYAVRYPNGFKGKAQCLGLLMCFQHPTGEAEGSWKQLSYIEARKRFYVPMYAKLVQQTSAFSQLKQLLQQGFNFQIADIDVPNVAGGFIPTLELFQRYINDASISFGHVWTLSMLLLGMM